MQMQISIDLANQILAYLGTRPYQEVFVLIQSIQDAAKASQPQEEKKQDD
jgi:hypothetical protein